VHFARRDPEDVAARTHMIRPSIASSITSFFVVACLSRCGAAVSFHPRT